MGRNSGSECQGPLYMNATCDFKVGLLTKRDEERENEDFSFLAIDCLKLSNVLEKRKRLCPGSLERILRAIWQQYTDCNFAPIFLPWRNILDTKTFSLPWISDSQNLNCHGKTIWKKMQTKQNTPG